MSELTTDQLEAARVALAAEQAANAGPPAESQTDAELGGALAAAGAQAADVDVNALLAELLSAQQALQAQVNALQAEKAQAKAEPVKTTAAALKAAILEHASGKTTGNGAIDHSALISLADDAVEAAGNAVESGDAGPLAAITARIVRALAKHHPGPGDHHWFRQAQSQAADLQDQAEAIVPQRAAAAVTSDRAPAKVVEGSVVG